jgi:hypothetical protein
MRTEVSPSSKLMEACDSTTVAGHSEFAVMPGSSGLSGPYSPRRRR